MNEYTRRDFFRQGCFGLAAAGAGGLVLQAEAEPTEGSGDLGEYVHFLAQEVPPVRQPEKWSPTEDNILGPFYRPGAPFRAKIPPPMEDGKVLVIRGRVWGHDTKKPLPKVVMDIWQANAKGRYDNDDPKKPPAKNEFRYRARIITDETGYYEYETIHPAPYQIGPKAWRPSHIHYLVRHPGYKSLITQLYFKGDKYNKSDRFIKQSLIVEVEEQKGPAGAYELGTFDIVLASK